MSTVSPTWIGFDLDHTIARYKLDELRQLNHACCRDFLENVRHYPKEKLIMEPVEALERRGAIIDKKFGNIIFIDERKTVYEAYHGTKPLTKEEISKIYIESIEFEGLTNDRFWPANSYFETFLMGQFAPLVDISDATESNVEASKRYFELTDDLHSSLYYNYADYDRGNFFKSFRENINKYIHKRPFMVDWLNEVHAKTDTQVFLCTNSMANFTDLLCTHCLGSNWRELFDLVIVVARKPHFFTHGCAKTSLDALAAYEVTYTGFTTYSLGDEQVFTMERDRVYMGGCAQQLEDMFVRDRQIFLDGVMTDDEKAPVVTPSDISVVYVGDHIVGDVKAAHGCCRQWRAVAVVEELAPMELKQSVPLALLCNVDEFFYAKLESPGVRHTQEIYSFDAFKKESFFFAPSGRLTFLANMLEENADVIVSDIHQLCSDNQGDPLHMFRQARSNVMFKRHADFDAEHTQTKHHE